MIWIETQRLLIEGFLFIGRNQGFIWIGLIVIIVGFWVIRDVKFRANS